MNTPASGAPLFLGATVAPVEFLTEPEVALLAGTSLVLTGFFAVLRAALLHSVPERVLEEAESDSARDALRPRLERAESLATSASIFETTFTIFFVVLVLAWIGGELTAATMGLALAVSVPPLVFATEILPSALRGERSDRLLRATLASFDIAQKPLAALIFGLEKTQGLVMRMLRIPTRPRSARRIVEDLRDVIEESEREADLEESEREIIENVVEFYDVDVAEVMTPRTELTAVEVQEGIGAVVAAIAESGHTRIPIYDKNLDSIVGIAYAQEILQLVSTDEFADASLDGLYQPVGFVPETKRVSELLTEFRQEKRKLAIVLDEYGGTAGIVTLGDIVAELVGDMREELGEEPPEPIRHRPDGTVEVAGSTRVSDINEELQLGIPEEEDYETMAGFVLSQLGRFPKSGETLLWQGTEITISQANDRRVFEVLLRPAKVSKVS